MNENSTCGVLSERRPILEEMVRELDSVLMRFEMANAEYQNRIDVLIGKRQEKNTPNPNPLVLDEENSASALLKNRIVRLDGMVSWFNSTSARLAEFV